MTSGETSEAGNYDPWQEAAEFAARTERNVQEAQAIAYPERAGERAVDVFPEPTQPRAAAEDPGFTANQEAELRVVAARLGFGGEYNLPTGADYVIIEGGKPWKVLAEAQVDQGIKIYAGSPNVKIGADQSDFMGELLRSRQTEAEREAGEEVHLPETEYDMVAQLATMEPGFEPLDEPLILPFGYDINDNYAPIEGPTGQLVQLGVANGQPVYQLRIDREDYYDETKGKMQYRKQPQSDDLLIIVNDWLESQEDGSSSIGLVTSSAYPSRMVSAVSAGLTHGRRLTIGMYSRQALADAKTLPGDETLASVEPVGINQLPGELWEISFRLAALKDQLAEHEAAGELGA